MPDSGKSRFKTAAFWWRAVVLLAGFALGDIVCAELGKNWYWWNRFALKVLCLGVVAGVSTFVDFGKNTENPG